ncbi:Uncharacterised protein [Legionella hackeliae]|uniref:hypothetical protein n=1 Tax=Legionella hackeliae TaxID=449 RepID=UPI000E1431AE|nr:hypothetical protein [Legionella hackeliae]STX48720.1 Uncharacterised protein [Legionella hackeliae]
MRANYFNPFSGIIETKNTAHARTFRTSLGTKFKDAFYVFHGKYDNVGLFDYVTLLSSAATLLFLQWCLRNKEHNKLAYFLLLPASAINIPIYIVKLVFSVMATLIATPMILAVQFVVNLMQGNAREKALTIEVTTSTGSYQTLQKLLETEGMELEALEATVSPVNQDSLQYKIDLAKKGIDTDKNPTIELIQDHYIQLDYQEKSVLSAFFRLNVGE